MELNERAARLKMLVECVKFQIDAGRADGVADQHLDRAQKELEHALRNLGGAIPGERP
jgi:hypothetical protein